MPLHTPLIDFRLCSVKAIQPTGEETPSLNRNYSTKVKTFPTVLLQIFPFHTLARCSQERQRLQTEPEVSLVPKKGKINLS